MKPLVSATGFEQSLAILVMIGFLVGLCGYLLYRKKAENTGIVISLCFCVVSLAIYLLWQIEKYCIGIFGLDSIPGLGIMAVVFCLVGVMSTALIIAISKRGR